MSRLDAFLKNTGVFKARTQARKACDEGRVLVGGEPARGSRTIRVGEQLTVDTDTQRIEAQVLEVPTRPVARNQRERFLQQTQRQSLAQDVLSFDDEP